MPLSIRGGCIRVREEKFGGKIATAVSDKGLRKLLTWVFTALVATVLFAILVVELTLRWFR